MSKLSRTNRHVCRKEYEKIIHAHVMELVDIQVSKTCAEGRAGSTPAVGTNGGCHS